MDHSAAAEGAVTSRVMRRLLPFLFDVRARAGARRGSPVSRR